MEAEDLIDVYEGMQPQIIYLEKNGQIRFLRKQLKLTQEEFADVLGVSKLTVCRWENDIRECNGAALKLINILTKYSLWESER